MKDVTTGNACDSSGRPETTLRSLSLEQTTLDGLHPCPTCHGTGRRPNRETEAIETCRVCEGAGTVPFDPDDHSEIPY